MSKSFQKDFRSDSLGGDGALAGHTEVLFPVSPAPRWLQRGQGTGQQGQGTRPASVPLPPAE